MQAFHPLGMNCGDSIDSKTKKKQCRTVPSEKVDTNMFMYFTDCWDRWEDYEDTDTLVAIASIAADYDENTATFGEPTPNSTAISRHVHTEKGDSNEQWENCFEGFFDRLADEFAKIMGCDENCGCGGRGGE